MAKEIELIWIRHGQTQWNMDRRFQGQLNPPLNAEGLRQARRVAQRLAAEGPFDALVSSDLARAVQTAQAISAAVRLPISAYYTELRERHMGRLEGLTHEEAEMSYGPAFRQMSLGKESPEHFRMRAVLAAELIIAQHRDRQRILVTSHGGLIKAFLLAYQLPFQGPLQNTSLTKVVRSGTGKWQLLTLNDVEHLATPA
ncbi:MAG TPA: histidine phosphatase family protein [Firmicutes bacterium]|jgi:probable phosphoglycerate mutase|nr:histidine phosphatase family protein [Bacillota bacterium]